MLSPYRGCCRWDRSELVVRVETKKVEWRVWPQIILIQVAISRILPIESPIFGTTRLVISIWTSPSLSSLRVS